MLENLTPEEREELLEEAKTPWGEACSDSLTQNDPALAAKLAAEGTLSLFVGMKVRQASDRMASAMQSGMDAQQAQNLAWRECLLTAPASQ